MTRLGAAFLTERDLPMPRSVRSMEFLITSTDFLDARLAGSGRLGGERLTDCVRCGFLADERKSAAAGLNAPRSASGRLRNSFAKASYTCCRDSSPAAPWWALRSADEKTASSPAFRMAERVGKRCPRSFLSVGTSLTERARVRREVGWVAGSTEGSWWLDCLLWGHRKRATTTIVARSRRLRTRLVATMAGWRMGA